MSQDEYQHGNIQGWEKGTAYDQSDKPVVAHLTEENAALREQLAACLSAIRGLLWWMPTVKPAPEVTAAFLEHQRAAVNCIGDLSAAAAAYREGIEKPLRAERDAALARVAQLEAALQNICYMVARISPPPYGHRCQWCSDCVTRAKDDARAALTTPAALWLAEQLKEQRANFVKRIKRAIEDPGKWAVLMSGNEVDAGLAQLISATAKVCETQLAEQLAAAKLEGAREATTRLRRCNRATCQIIGQHTAECEAEAAREEEQEK
jgi:hypothetical protein